MKSPMSCTIDVDDGQVDVTVWGNDEDKGYQLSTELTKSLQSQIRLVIRNVRHNQENGPYDWNGNRVEP